MTQNNETIANALKTKLKGYFKTGDRPTQEQFKELIDSIVDKEQLGLLEETIKKLQECCSKSKDYPIIKLSHFVDFKDAVIRSNQAARKAGLVTGSLYWMEILNTNLPLNLMRVSDLGSGVDGIGDGILDIWSDNFSLPEML